MKPYTSIAITFLLVLSVLPAVAGDQIGSQAVDQTVEKATVSFQALSKLSDTERQSLAPLTDTELASIKGAGDSGAALAINTSFLTQIATNSGNATVSAAQSATASGTGSSASNSALAAIGVNNSATVVQGASAHVRIH